MNESAILAARRNKTATRQCQMCRRVMPVMCSENRRFIASGGDAEDSAVLPDFISLVSRFHIPMLKECFSMFQ